MEGSRLLPLGGITRGKVGLYPLDDHTYEVRFAEHVLGTVDIREEMFAPRVKAGSKQPYIKGRRVQRAEIKEGD